jgi:hypothetical protein
MPFSKPPHFPEVRRHLTRAAERGEWSWQEMNRFLWVRCPACRTINAIDLRTLDRDRDAAVTSLVPALSCHPSESAIGIIWQLLERFRQSVRCYDRTVFVGQTHLFELFESKPEFLSICQ